MSKLIRIPDPDLVSKFSWNRNADSVSGLLLIRIRIIAKQLCAVSLQTVIFLVFIIMRPYDPEVWVNIKERDIFFCLTLI